MKEVHKFGRQNNIINKYSKSYGLIFSAR